MSVAPSRSQHLLDRIIIFVALCSWAVAAACSQVPSLPASQPRRACVQVRLHCAMHYRASFFSLPGRGRRASTAAVNSSFRVTECVRKIRSSKPLAPAGLFFCVGMPRRRALCCIAASGRSDGVPASGFDAAVWSGALLSGVFGRSGTRLGARRDGPGREGIGALRAVADFRRR